MIRLCLCKICNCGRHRCTQQPLALYSKDCQGYGVTEYAEKYPGYQSYQPVKSIKPKPEQKSKHEQMERITTTRSDFIPYEVIKRPEMKKVGYQPNPGKMDMDTTYKQEFGPYELERVSLQRPKQKIQGATGKLDTVPTYKEDFCWWEISKRERPKSRASYNPPTEKFGNATTFQADFVPRAIALRESFKPLNVVKPSDDPFDGVTSNQLFYIPHPINVRFAKAPNEYKPSDEPFQGLTTHRQDYQGLPGKMPKTCKPEHIKLSSKLPFQSSTEFRDRFQPWAASPVQQQKTPEYVSPTVEMDLNTTSGTTFIKHNIQPFVSAKPLYRPTCSSVPFEGHTTMKEDFKAWKAQRQEMIRKTPKIQKGSGKMEDKTTFQVHYIQHQLQPSASCKPLSVALQSEEPLDEKTTYTTEFTPKKINVCPASFDPVPGFIFEKVDDTGHRLFRKLSPQK